jgi:cell wall-associated NlpC family hydrolase
MRGRGALAVISAAALVLAAGCSTRSNSDDSVGGGANAAWDAGNIISDQVMYNSAAFASVNDVQIALNNVGQGCDAPTCLAKAQYTPGPVGSYCTGYPGPAGAQSYASILYYLGKACGVNPQVVIVMIQKESQGLTRPTPPAALTGFGCPDSGPGGSANCNSGVGGVWAQTAGVFGSIAKGHQDASVVARYIEGQTHDILWNVEESGCGSAPVTVKNRATAWLYTYTPYQPNQAALDAYPGTGDSCSAYGNRNFFRMFQKYFGDTGGGRAAPGQSGANLANGVSVKIPDNQFVDQAVRGKTITAPSEAMARGIAAGFDQLGLPYVWGGAGSGAGPNDGCARGGGALNSCQGIIGFDCSGLTAFVLGQAGFQVPGDSGSQRSGGAGVPKDQAVAGDIYGFPGHVAVALGFIDGTPYILEASDVGIPIHVVPMRRGDVDSQVHRYWGSSSSA